MAAAVLSSLTPLFRFATTSNTPALAHGATTADATRENTTAPATTPPDVHDTWSCHHIPMPLRAAFDDLDALECGHAREFIPTEHLAAHKSWWQCRVTRTDKLKFSMVLEAPAKSHKKDRFLMCARKVGSDFYISRYEAFTEEGDAQTEPTGRYCAVVTRLSHVGEYELRAMGRHNHRLVHVRHGVIQQRECGAEIRTLEATMPRPRERASQPDM